MKTLQNFLTKNPGYFKRGSQSLAERTNISINTVIKYKKSSEYSEMKKTYLNSI